MEAKRAGAFRHPAGTEGYCGDPRSGQDCSRLMEGKRDTGLIQEATSVKGKQQVRLICRTEAEWNQRAH